MILIQMRQYLAAGNDEAILQELGQFQGNGELPTEVSTVLKEIRQRLGEERKARESAFAEEVDAAVQRASAAVPKAKVPKDLDAALQELVGLSGRQGVSRYGDGRDSDAARKLQGAITFINRWQDYLLSLTRGDESRVGNILRNLAETSNQPLLVPRSTILALEPETDSEGRPQTSRAAQRSQTQIDAEAVDIVRGVKKLDDVPAAVAKLVELRTETTSRSYNMASDSALGTALGGLQAIQKTMLELQSGLATTRSLTSGRNDYNNSHPEIENALLPLRVQIVKLGAPRLMEIPADEKPVEDETLDVYLRRLIKSAKKRQQWADVMRGLELKHMAAAITSSASVARFDDTETTAFKSFFAGRNLEEAGQYEQAVISYLTALRTGQEDLPSAFIGERLTTIQKAHPAEYASGSKYVLDPPRPAYPDYPRPGPPGFYGAAGMPRGAMYDPRFPNRSGGPGPALAPADDSLSVPAAGPSPTPSPAVVPEKPPGSSPTPASAVNPPSAPGK